jgi:hypothetical protein
MQSKFLKNILLATTIAFSLLSLTYFARTVIDIGCAKTEIGEDSIARHFIGLNCWIWEGAVQLQSNIKF